MPVSDQGISDNRYRLIPRTLIFLTCESKILLLKGNPDKRIWPNLYNGIGGHIERGEDVLSAAQRELAEETGLVDIKLWLCGTITVDANADTGIAIFVLRGEYPASKQLPFTTPCVSSEGVLEWHLIDQVTSLPLVEDLPALLPRLLQMHAGDAPFSARYKYDEKGKLIVSFYE